MVNEESRIVGDELEPNSNLNLGTRQQEEDQEERESEKKSAGDRVWTMQELYKHRGYSRGLYNFAWAQAVQKKPLTEPPVDVVAEVAANGHDAAKLANAEEEVVVDGNGDVEEIVGEVERESEKEEGELEEGEIDMEEGGEEDGNVGEVGGGKEEEEEDGGGDGVGDEEVVDMDCGLIDESEFDDRVLAKRWRV